MTPQEKARARLRHFVAHSADHMREHAREIAAHYAAIGDPALCALIERAVAEMGRADAALDAVRVRLEAATAPTSPGGYALRCPGAAAEPGRSGA